MTRFEQTACDKMDLAKTETELDAAYEKACDICCSNPGRAHCSCFACPVALWHDERREDFP